VLTPDWIERYMGAIDDRNPWYTSDSPFGGPIAPCAVLNYELQMFGGWHPPGIKGAILNTQQSWEFHRPLRPGQRLRLTGRVNARYRRRGREYIAMEASAWDLEGNLLCRTVTIDAWPIADSGGASEP
jgi:hypothetical protein